MLMELVLGTSTLWKTLWKYYEHIMQHLQQLYVASVIGFPNKEMKFSGSE